MAKNLLDFLISVIDRLFIRHKVVYIGSRCEQIEAEYTQTKEYLNSELKKANDQTEAVRQEKVDIWCLIFPCLATGSILWLFSRFFTLP